jgi:hypothetical protein
LGNGLYLKGRNALEIGPFHEISEEGIPEAYIEVIKE